MLRTLISGFFLFVATLGSFATPLTLKTTDTLEVQFSKDGITKVVIAGEAWKTSARTIGANFLVREAGTKSAAFKPIRGETTAANGDVRFVGEHDHLSISANFRSKRDYIEVNGLLQNKMSGDRCVDLKFILPINCRDAFWGKNLVTESLIKDSVSGEQTADRITDYPIAPVSDRNVGAGISIAVPPTSPTIFETGASDEGLYIKFKVGLSQSTVPSGVTSFHFVLYRHDAAWGFRSSLQRYYDLFHDPFFTRRVTKFGAWGWHYPPPSQVSNSNLYAFHEAGGELWQIKDEGMHGYEHEGVNLATNLTDFVRLTKTKDDEKLGIYTLPYTIVGQRQIYHLDKMPTTHDAALREFEKWTVDEPMLFQCPGPSVSFRSVSQLKEIIRNSCVYDEEQKPNILMRQYLGNTLTFPQNPNPLLFSDKTNLTIAKYTLDDYLPMLFSASKMIDGCYVDSLGRWPGYYNFRKEHFRYTTMPLTYSGTALQPCIWNLQSHAEYLQELSRRLHAQNKIVFANGVHVNRVMLGFYVDVLGEEGIPDFTKSGFYSKRVAAYDKPFCALNGRDNINPRIWNSCLYHGILIGARSFEGQKLERKFLPAIIRLNEAGWRPITMATTDSPAVAIERWGDGREKPLLFSFLNKTKNKVTTTVHVDSSLLRNDKVLFTNIMSGAQISPVTGKAIKSFSLELEPETATAIEVKTTK